jgi:nucleoid-associated protein Lsr2
MSALACSASEFSGEQWPWREVIENVIDDLDGRGDGDGPVRSHGTSYEIDASNKNAAAVGQALDRHTRGAPLKRDVDRVQLREWAAANGVAVPTRGRIRQAIVEQYMAAADAGDRHEVRTSTSDPSVPDRASTVRAWTCGVRCP